MKTELTERQEREREFYEKYAKLQIDLDVSFDPVSGRERRPWNSYWRVYEMVRELYQSGARKLLDFGCGPGDSAVRFAHIGYEVSGFDIGPQNIETATKLARKYGFKNKAHFTVQSAESLNYPDDCFDIVVGLNILHHIEIKPSVEETLRVLKPGGVAVFREHSEAPFIDRLRNTWLIRKWWPNTKSMDLHHHITEDERKLSKQDILTILTLCPQTNVERFKVLSRLDRFVRRPGSPHASLLERIDSRMLKVFPFLSKLGDSAVLTLHKPNPCD